VRDSEFFSRWNEFLHAPGFVSFLEANHLVADLYLHANMQPHVGLFDLSHINVIRHGDMAIQDLLLRSAALVTDYTSAAIDFSFLDRPVIYYQFDRTRFLGRRPSHFDLDEELPGEIVATPGELIGALEKVAARGLTIHPDAQRKSRALIDHRDTGARERIVQAAARAPARRLDPPILRDGIQTTRRVLRRVKRHRAVRVAEERVKEPLRTGLFAVARRLPRSGVMVFESNLGADLGDSPGAIHRAVVRRGLAVRTAWVVKPTVAPPAGSLGVERLSWRYLWVMGRARAWVSNQNQPSWMRRPEDTFYLQTWHGTPLKRMLHDLDAVVGRDDGYLGRVDRMIEEWSLLLSPSPWATARFRSAFCYSGDVLESGYPRNDALADGSAHASAAAVRKQLGLASSKKVLLYAPTFRDDQRSGRRFTFSLPIDLPALLAALGADYEVVVRLHPVVRGKVKLPWGVHNAGGGFRMEDLLAVADVLVTDYSSVMFDYATLDRPMAFFVPDLEHYRDSLRGFYLDFEAHAPGPLVRTTAELVSVLRDEEALDRSYAEARHAFRAQFCPADDGGAADRVVDALIERGVLPAG
jgi:CDP-glycerol glycerophosphotransferase